MPPPDDLSPAPDLFDSAKSELNAGSCTHSPTTPRNSRPTTHAPLGTGCGVTLADDHDDLAHQNQPTGEKLIPTAQGVGHYVGPSSSFWFVMAIRRLVGQSNRISAPSFQSALRADFATLGASKALELQDTAQEIGDNVAAVNLPKTPATGPDVVETHVAPAPSLPPRETSDALMLAFFDKIHPDYPLFHRDMFQLRYEALWEPRPGPLRTTDTGWMCCLAMVFVFGAQALEQHDKQQAASIQRSYLALVRSSFRQLVGTTSLANVQALLLLQLYEHNSGQRNASWMFLGCALRMAIALGMHRDLPNKTGVDPVEWATRRRVWWTLYTFERNLSVMLGRPSAINDSEVSTKMPDGSDMSDNGKVPPRYTESLLHLTRILGQVRQSAYASPDDEAELPPLSKAQKLLGELRSWYSAQPAYLRPGWRTMIPHQRRAVLLLHIYYQYMIMLATRPHFLDWERRELLKRQGYSDAGRTLRATADENTAIFMKETCLEAAEKTVSYCHLLADGGILDTTSWLDVYYIYHAVFVLCLDLFTNKSGGNSLSEAQSRCKESVKSIFAVLRRRQLAPTFCILIRVASQFARIAGAIDDDTAADGGTNVAASVRQSQAESTNIEASSTSIDAASFSLGAVGSGSATAAEIGQDLMVDDWLLSDLSSLSWNSFDMGAYATPSSTNFTEGQLNVTGAGIFSAEQGLFGSMVMSDFMDDVTRKLPLHSDS